MERSEEFKDKLYALLKEYSFTLSAGGMGAEINLQGDRQILGYWEGSIPGRWVGFE